MKKALLLTLATAALLAGCNYTQKVMYINLANQSGQTLHNIELKHPTGTVGLPQLKDGQTHRHMAPIGSPCTFNVQFEDGAGKLVHKDFNLGEKCPAEVAFDVKDGMQISQRTVR